MELLQRLETTAGVADHSQGLRCERGSAAAGPRVAAVVDANAAWPAGANAGDCEGEWPASRRAGAVHPDTSHRR